MGALLSCYLEATAVNNFIGPWLRTDLFDPGIGWLLKSSCFDFFGTF